MLYNTRALAIDSSGNVFVAGRTYSSDYPTTEGAYDTTYDKSGDIFVSKLDSNLSSLLSSTFIGRSIEGSSEDTASALAIDLSGDVFVAGHTGSSDYPTTEGAYDTTHNGYRDVFVSKFDSNLSSLLSSTFIGGIGNVNDYAEALAIDSSGDVFVAGRTHSSGYPTTIGAYDTVHNGYHDAFVSKFDSNLTSLLLSTFIGGSDYDDAEALAIDSSGNVFVAGGTRSSDYPTTEGAYDTVYNSSDVFVSKLDSRLSSLVSSTFIGGSTYDYAYALAIDSSGDVFVAGWTGSSDYPTTVGAYDTTFNGSYDVFISKLDSDLSGEVPNIAVTPADKDFGSVRKETTSLPATFTISNTGGADLVIGGVYLTGTNPYQFSIQNDTCSDQTIAPSGSCTIKAVFSPTKKTTFNALIGIDSNDPDTPTLNIELTGTGVEDHEEEHEEH
ncbi:MAG TPA: choice-of-anchor D domain-containing protein [Nitrospirae bacterium]|nr:choice-of-anchor D domain-containing protein [Nitrospirota bacterium]